MVSMDDIRALSDAIAREFHPERIILFGSHAYGAPNEDSDVDLLVVMRHEGSDIQMAVKILRTVKPRFGLDLLVRTPEVLRQRIEWEDFFLREITSKGKVLYEAAHAGVGQ